MLVSVASFAVMDAILKLLSEHYPALQVAFLRAAASLPFVLLVIVVRGRLDRIRPVNVRLHLFRGALAVLMLYAFISAVRESSLATTYSIFMFAPLLVAALSVPILGEKVVGGQWAAISAGFLGVLVMLGPVNGQWLSTGSLWAIVGLITYAVAIVSLRLLSRTDSTESMVLGFTVLLMIGAGVLAIPEWREVRWVEDFKLIFGVGLMASIGQQMITVAFRNAPAAVVAPFEYTALVWGVLLDIAIWSVYPSALTLMGGSIVIGAGLYLIQRERRATAVAAETTAPR
ncbi:MAG: DMT family transporter [Gammaproteobacteria bacterium]|nr:DMT family transporter [Gammaproteobacteria bacterium]MDH5227069.1 DMT family transporter [Gammaproteobacteria bacterium]